MSGRADWTGPAGARGRSDRTGPAGAHSAAHPPAPAAMRTAAPPPAPAAMRTAAYPPRGGPRGFTLVELIVALAIFALLASAGVALLRSGADSTRMAAARSDETARLLRLRALLIDDLGQAAPRRVRDSNAVLLPAFAGTRGDRRDEPLIALTRRGWTNDDALPRASLQRVEWRLSPAGALERRAWPMLDGAEPGPPAVLMTGITGARLRFRREGAWSDRWDDPAGLPDAVEIALDRPGGRLTQAFLVGPP
jgi:general secretion pathway protein J